jgi:hypothetical protein
MDATSRPYDGVGPGRTEESTETGNEHESDADGDASQRDEDARRQSELTRSVGIRLTRPEKRGTTARVIVGEALPGELSADRPVPVSAKQKELW